MKPTLIKTRSLAIGYGDKPIQSGIDLEIAAGEVFLILGGSGTGKSTLLKHMIGLQRPISGSVELVGHGDPMELSGRPPFGVAFQGGALFGSMTVAENVALPLETWTDLDAETIAEIVSGKLRLVDLGGYGNHLPAAISGGMRKRAAIARALALEPALLFLDEPSAGLDPVSAAELDALLITLNRSLGMTMVIVTHELPSIFAIGTRCVLLDKESGGPIAEGDPSLLRDRSSDERVRRFLRREVGA